jgi:hemerythrin superfamily protein
MADPRFPEAPDVLRADHRRLRSLFRAYARCADPEFREKTELFLEIERALTIHSEIEEAFFYPAVAGKRANEAREEHEIVKTLLTELSALAAENPAFDAKIKVLGETFEHHARDEERELFPRFRSLAQDVRRRVSADLRARRAEFSGA